MISRTKKILIDILDAGFYQRDTSIVAAELIGKILVKKYPESGPETILSGVITETEAYYGSEDPASHAFRGITQRSRLMFGKPGIAYIYFCYGMHYMFNVVTEKKGRPGAVLIRAVKPVEGLELMKKNRNTLESRKLTDGPGKLTEAFGIDLKDNGRDLTDTGSGLNIYSSPMPAGGIKVSRSCRIGISKGKEKQLRFVIENDNYL